MTVGTFRLSIVFIVLLFSAGATTANAGGCSVASIRGSFGIVDQGTFVKPIPSLPVPAPLPYTASGIATFDGAGHFSGKITVNLGGVSLPVTFTGTYAVDHDCTFSTQFTNSLGLVAHQVGTLTGEGIFSEGHYMYTDENRVATGTARRLSSGR